MITTIDSETGGLTLTPDSETDRQLILSLMDCTDLSQFTEYIEYHKHSITTDLGISPETIKSYMASSQPVPLKLGNSMREIPIRPDHCLPPKQSSSETGSLYIGNIIGFNRDGSC